MIYNIFTDPHLGTSRAMHTTPASSKRLQRKLFDAAYNALHPGHQNIVVGDLFDKSSNPEAVILQGLAIAQNAYVLAGNHDEANRDGAVTSLSLIAEACPGQVIEVPRASEAYFYQEDNAYFVPHHPSQELFLQALSKAHDHAEERLQTYDSSRLIRPHQILFVHCNRGEMPQQDDSTLVISLELEDKLTQVFSRVFYGHVHGSDSNKVSGDKVLSKGVVLGNTHPTSFGDISNKYSYTYDQITDELTRHLIWYKADHYVKISVTDEELPVGEFQFVEVTGMASRQDAAEFMQRAWETYPDAYAIRNNCTYIEEAAAQIEEVNLDDLPTEIEKSLHGSDLLELFKEIKEQVCN